MRAKGAHTAAGGSSNGFTNTNGHGSYSTNGSTYTSSRGTGMYYCMQCGLSSSTELLVQSGALFP